MAAADVNFEKLIRTQIELSSPHELTASPPPPLHEILAGAAANAGKSKSELQEALLRIVEKSAASNGDPRVATWLVASGALSALARTGDASTLDRIMGIAREGPKQLVSTATMAAVSIANRIAPQRLAEIARELAKAKTTTPVYAQLHYLLRSELPADSAERDKRVQIILAILKDGVRNPEYQDRIYLDEVIAHHDSSYSSSEERQKILAELRMSENPIVKKYAEEKLARFPAEARATSKSGPPSSSAD